MKRWQPGDVLIEMGGRQRAVIVSECPEMYRSGVFSANMWGYYLEDADWFGGPWHTNRPDRFNPHPDPDPVWAKWAAHCARELAR